MLKTEIVQLICSVEFYGYRFLNLSSFITTLYFLIHSDNLNICLTSLSILIIIMEYIMTSRNHYYEKNRIPVMYYLTIILFFLNTLLQGCLGGVMIYYWYEIALGYVLLIKSLLLLTYSSLTCLMLVSDVNHRNDYKKYHKHILGLNPQNELLPILS